MNKQADASMIFATPSPVSEEGPIRSGVWRTSVLLLLTGLIVTSLAAWYAKSDADTNARRDFDFACKEIRDKILDRLKAHEQILRSGVAFYENSPQVTRKDWHDFTERQKVEQQLPGIQGIGFALLIPRSELAQHIEKIRAEGFLQYRVWPESEREIYSSILYLEPFAGRNLRAFGYDMLTEPIRREALERARDQDAAALTGKVTLVQETKEDVQAGTLMFVPAYRSDMPCKTVAERRAAILGWVYSPYRMNDLMQGILGGWDLEGGVCIHLQVFDGEKASLESLLYDSRPDKGHSPPTRSALDFQSSVESAGRRWTLYFAQSGHLADYGRVWLMLLGGTSISLLLFGLSFSLLNTHFNARLIAQKMTAEYKRVAEALAENEDKIHLLLDSTAEAIYGLDTNGDCTFCNSACVRLLGYNHPDELLGKNMHRQIHAIHPDGTPFAVEECRIFQAFQKGEGTHVDDEVFWRADGTSFPAEYWSYPQHHDGAVVGAVVTFLDITERKRAEAALRQATDRLSLATHAGGVGIWDYDVINNRLIWDEQMFRLYGITKDPFSGAYEAWQAGVHPEDGLRRNEEIQSALRGEKDFNTEFRVIWPDRTVHCIRALALVQRDAAGQPIRMIGTNWDITEKKQAEEELREKTTFLTGLLASIPDIVFFKNKQGKYLGCNPEFARLVNQDMVNIVGSTDYDLFPRESANLFRTQDHFMLDYGEPRHNEEWVEYPDGTRVLLDTLKAPLKDIDGHSIGILGVSRDITKRKQIEEKLASSEENFHTFFQTVEDMIAVASPEGDILFANEACSRRLGYASEELSAMHILEFHPVEYRKEAEAIFSAMLRGERNFCPLPYRTKEGSNLPVETHVWFGKWDGRDCIFHIAKDLSVQQAALEKFQRLFDNNLALMAVSSIPENKLIDVNNAFLDQLGLVRADVIGKNVKEAGVITDPIALDRLLDAINRQEHIVGMEVKLQAKNGELLDCLLSGEIFDNQGQKIFLSVAINLTAQKFAEAKVFQANWQLQEAKNLANEMSVRAQAAVKAKNAFLASMSHEIRTPLNAVIGMTGLLLDTSLDADQCEYSDTIRGSSEALLDIINDILDFSKIEADRLDLEKHPFDVVRCIEESLDLVNPGAIKKGIATSYRIEGNLPSWFIGDDARLRQILVNLLSNGIKFTEKGEVAVLLSGEPLEDDFYQLHFIVQDTGLGIPADRQDRLFQPFSQIHDSNNRRLSGTGLGLAISRRLCELMDGRMWVESSGVPGEGAAFHFSIKTATCDELCVLNERVAENALPPNPVPSTLDNGDFEQKSHLRILLADDNPINQKVALKMLAKLGYRADVVANGLEVLQSLRQIPYDVILMDCQMPEMDGYEATRQIRLVEQEEGRTPIHIIAMTAHGMQNDLKLCLESGMNDYLSKPVRINELEKALTAAAIVHECKNTEH